MHTPFPTEVINIPAGATAGIEWHHGLNNFTGLDPTDPADPIDSSHKGPIMVYLAKVDSALQSDVTGLKWFKIYEDGLESDLTTWAVDKMIANKGIVNFPIPSCIPSGNYLMRAELSKSLDQLLHHAILIASHSRVTPCFDLPWCAILHGLRSDQHYRRWKRFACDC